MRAAVALLVSLTMMLAGCFPHDAHKQTIAKWSEGGALIAGIAISAVSNTGADCDANNMAPGTSNEDCRTKAKWLSTAGVTLILAGLIGFIATVSTAEDAVQKKTGTTTVPDDGKRPPSVKTNPTPPPPPTDQTSGATAGSGAPGSADGAGSGAATPPPSP